MYQKMPETCTKKLRVVSGLGVAVVGGEHLDDLLDGVAFVPADLEPIR
jgi:hypothetical protein